MDYYNKIKEELINNEIYKKVKDYSKNKNDLETYYSVGKLIVEAQGGEERSEYGNQLIKEYSLKLTKELGKGYSARNLYNMRLYYLLFSNNVILQPLAAKLTWSHYTILLNLKDVKQIYYYIETSIKYNLSKRELITKIKNKEYERLDESTKMKLSKKEEIQINDFIKNPIIIKNMYNKEIITEKALKLLILEQLNHFMKELGDSFSYIDHEYKIKLENRYNYIDLLLFNIKYNCYVVVELKIIELKKEHIGQIQTYMNYIDKHIKNITHNKTIGIIICAKDNKIILEYSSDPRIFETKFVLN